ncbi:MAG: 4Fe-4S binding protein, partial [Marinibacterium sp.]
DHTMQRLQTLAQAYLAAGGTAPRLLATDAAGSDMIRAAARFGRGLPADVIPMEVASIGGFGHAEAVAARAAGCAAVYVLPAGVQDPAERDAMAAQVALACAIAGDGSVGLLDMRDPDALSDTLFDDPRPANATHAVRPAGTRRQITRQAARALCPDIPSLPLPQGAPYGAVLVDPDACTLCLSCVSLCPSGALGDNPDLPQLRFQEDACLQCGLCARICPEDAITYEPRLNLADSALDQVTLHEEDPFACIECGALFGVKSTVERVMEKLAGHAMFADGDALRLIQMCDTCRINAQFHSDDNPFADKERPRPRTTDDYLSKRRDH